MTDVFLNLAECRNAHGGLFDYQNVPKRPFYWSWGRQTVDMVQDDADFKF